MRFIDSNVFLHAFLVPRRALTSEEQFVKDEAKKIVKRVEEGEEVVMSTVHLSEIINILESGVGLQKSFRFLAWIIACNNIAVRSVSLRDYEAAFPLAKENDVSVNDALAYSFMIDEGVKEIYSFDSHFDNFKDIKRLPNLPMRVRNNRVKT